jgi:hypothetical protein
MITRKTSPWILAAIPAPVDNPDPTTIMLSSAMQTTAPADGLTSRHLAGATTQT